MSKILSNYILENFIDGHPIIWTRYEVIDGSLGTILSSGFVARILLLSKGNFHYSIVKNRCGIISSNTAYSFYQRKCSSFEEANRKLTQLIFEHGYTILKDDFALLLEGRSG